jgi:tetratricopeptide (TPR) repeat protein
MDSLSDFLQLATEEYLKKTKDEDYHLLHNLLTRCRLKKYYYFGYFCGKLLESVNNYRILEELAICAYYIEKYQESFDLYAKILQICPKHEKERMIKNQSYNIIKLKREIKND